MIGISAIINLITLCIAFALILWGKKIFKYYIILMGIIIGAGVGAGISTVSSMSADNALAGAVIGAIILGALAWPLHRLFVFIISGLIVGSLSMLILSSIGISSGLIVFGLIFFVLGGILGLKLSDYFIIIIMAYTGATMIFNTMFSVIIFRGGFSGFSFKTLQMLYTRYLLAYLLVLAMYILFALYYQLRITDKKEDNDQVRRMKLGSRKVSYFFIALASLTSILATEMPTVSVAVGVLLFHVPLLAFITPKILQWIETADLGFLSIPDENLRRMVALVVFSLIGIPVLTGLLNSILMSAMQQFLVTFSSFVSGSVTLILFRWLFAGLIIPGLLYLMLQSMRKNTEMDSTLKPQTT